MDNRIIATLRVIVCLSITAAFVNGTVRAEDELASEMNRVVKVIKENLGAANSIRVEPLRDLSAGTRLSGAVTPGLTQAFSEACVRAGLVIDKGSAHIVEGRFTVTDQEQLTAGDPMVLEIQFALLNRRGQRLVEILPIEVPAPGQPAPNNFAVVSAPGIVAQAVGLVGIVASSAQPAARIDSARVNEIALQPTGVVRGTLIKCSPRSEFEVEILATPKGTSDFKPLQARIEDGHPYVDIPIGHVYRIAVHNRSDRPVAVATSIDGLNSFHFADGAFRDPKTNELKIKHYIFAENSSRLVMGWHYRHQGENNIGRFLVTDYGDRAANALEPISADAAGAIHLQFCECLTPQASRGFTPRGAPNKRTTQGESETVKFNTSDLIPGKPLEFLTIRYDR